MHILGHRGCIQRNVYENTLKAFNIALKHTNGFETDACNSKDSEIFFIHEAACVHNKVSYSLNFHLEEDSQHKTEGRRLDEMTAAEIKQLRVIDGQTIPTFEETVQLFTNNSDKIWNIELKSEHAAEHIIPKIQNALQQEQIKEEQFIISSFNHTALLLIKEHFPNIALGALFTAAEEEHTKLYPWSPDNKACYTPLNEESLSANLIHQIKPNFVIAPHTELNEEQLTLIQRTNPQAKAVIWVFTEWPKFDKETFFEQAQHFANKNLLDTIIIDNVEGFHDKG